MPVEPTRIKGRVRALFPNANLSNKRMDELSARLAQKPVDDADDAVIDELLNNANDFMPFADLAKEDDRIRSLEANQKKPDATPAPDPTVPPVVEPTVTPPSDAIPSWAKTIMETVNELKTGKIIESKTQAARAEFDKSEVFKSTTEKGREFYFKQLDVNSETPIADQLLELEATHSEITQSKADSAEHSGKPPVHTSNEKADKELISRIVGN